MGWLWWDSPTGCHIWVELEFIATSKLSAGGKGGSAGKEVESVSYIWLDMALITIQRKPSHRTVDHFRIFDLLLC